MRARSVAALAAIAVFAPACISEYRPVSPLALPALADEADRSGVARALDMKTGERFEVSRGFDVEIVAADPKREPRPMSGPIRASAVSSDEVVVESATDHQAFTLSRDVKWVGVRVPSPGRTALFGVLLGTLGSIVVTSVVIVSTSKQQPPRFVANWE